MYFFSIDTKNATVTLDIRPTNIQIKPFEMTDPLRAERKRVAPIVPKRKGDIKNHHAFKYCMGLSLPHNLKLVYPKNSAPINLASSKVETSEPTAKLRTTITHHINLTKSLIYLLLMNLNSHVISPHATPINPPITISANTMTIATPILSDDECALLIAIYSAIPKQNMHRISSKVPAAIIYDGIFFFSP